MDSAAGRTSLFANVPSTTSFGSVPRSQWTFGVPQTWPMYSANYRGTRYLAQATTDTPHSFMDTLHAFNAVSLPDALQQLTYHGVIDEDHFFTLGRTVSSRLSSIKGVLSIARNAYNLGSGDAETLLLKVNRLTGSLTQFRAIGLSTANPDATVRGPLFLHRDFVFLTSATQNIVWKLRKADFSLVWSCALPGWYELRPAGTGPLSGYPVYYTTTVLVIDTIAEFPRVIVSTSAGQSYGPHDISPASFAVNNLERLVEYHHGIGLIFGLTDLGTVPTVDYVISAGPSVLRQGDVLPDESFAPDESAVEIWDSITESMLFQDGAPLTGVPRTSGTYLFPVEMIEIASRAFLREYDVGYISFGHGFVFNSSKSYLLENVTDPFGRVQPSSVEIQGTYLLGLPITRTLYKPQPDGRPYILSAREAWGLNYFGASIYGMTCYDEDSGLIYVPTGNAYAMPVSDKLAAQASNSRYQEKSATWPKTSYRFDDVFLDYSTEMNRAYEVYMSGSNTSGAFSLARLGVDNMKQVLLRRRSILKSRSPRYQRFLNGAVVAINAATGSLQWGQSILGPDVHDNIWFLEPMSVLLLYQEMGINHDIISVAITEARGSKILIAAGKIAVGVYNLSSRNVGFTAVHGEDPFAAAGLMNMRTPELRVDMIMFTTLAVHGGLVVHEDLYYYSSSNQGSSRLPLINRAPLVDDVSPILEPFPFVNPITIWAIEILTGKVRWVRMIDPRSKTRSPLPSSSQAGDSSSIVGYGEVLVAGSNYGTIYVLDLLSGRQRAEVPTTSGASTGVPIVNYVGFHMGGTGKMSNPQTFARAVEMLTPLGR